MKKLEDLLSKISQELAHEIREIVAFGTIDNKTIVETLNFLEDHDL